ncbi:NUDIX hydrolase [Salinispora arenicola]|uniref:NUDIX hydrolase n=1 Tax=Salinispora arenicola TaxID=168697 RepID=UPI000374D1B7|nr:NUDIX domain-containing protein [Salinispora arenicola]
MPTACGDACRGVAVLRSANSRLRKDANMYRPHAFPVSVKGVCVRDGRVLLLRNEREEWELPGGKLELGEDPAACVGREISEETGWTVRVGPILDSWQYHIRDGIDVLIVTYGCFVDDDSPITVSSEHKEARLFAADEIAALPMPDGYRRSIHDWFTRLETPISR